MKKYLSTLMLLAFTAIAVNAYTIYSSGGDLADKSPRFNESGQTELVIEGGELTAADVQALALIGNNAQTIRMDGVTLTDEARTAEFAFASTSVTSIVLPKDLPKVKSEWFSSCTNLGSAISFSTDGKSLKAHNNLSETLKAAMTLAGKDDGTGIEELIISGHVSSADISRNYPNAMYLGNIKHYDLSNATLSSASDLICTGSEVNATDLEQIEIPLNLTSIPGNCFKACANLKGIYIPNSVTTIGENAFLDCTNLEKVEFQEGFDELDFGNAVFKDCKKLKHIVIPEGVTNIGANMFNECNSDLYLMATSPTDLPTIYTNTFGVGNMNADNSGPFLEYFANHLKKLISRNKVTGVTADQVDKWLASPAKYDSDKGKYYDQLIFSYLSEEEIIDVYREYTKSLDPTNQTVELTMLHYVNNDEMTEFLNGNPWYGSVAPGFNVYASPYGDDYQRRISETNRINNAEHLSDAYGFGPDKNGYYWPDLNHGDYTVRNNYGTPSNTINSNQTIYSKTEPSQIVWRKFALIKGFETEEDEVFTKKYDDTWYTMCFPFDLTDEQLEGAFNPNFNICEFNGALVQETETTDGSSVNNLVLLFTNIATTFYRDKYGDFYVREYDSDGNKIYYPAERVQKNNLGDFYVNKTGASPLTKDSEDSDIYHSIEGVLAVAGRPYMIHPQKVEKDGHATDCVLNHIQYKFELNKLKKAYLAETTNAEKKAAYEAAVANVKDMYDAEAVTRRLSEFVENVTITETNEGDYDYVNLASGKMVMQPITGGGNYTFKGTYLPTGLPAGDEVPIPYRAYFLSVKNPTVSKYPKFFRQASDNPGRTGRWKQYSAIVIPDDTAIAWEGANLNVTSSSSNAKGISLGFADDVEWVDQNEVNAIISAAQKNGQEVQKYNVIVNINGQVVREGLDMTGLPKGIYIVNGKKYMVK